MLYRSLDLLFERYIEADRGHTCYPLTRLCSQSSFATAEMLTNYRNPVKTIHNLHHFDHDNNKDQLYIDFPILQSQAIVLATSSSTFYSKQVYLEDYVKQFTLSSQLYNAILVGIISSMPILQDYEKFMQNERGKQYENLL